MDTGLITLALPIALAIIMMGIGLELSLQDFKRVVKYPKAVFIALFCQLVILTAVAFIITQVLHLPPLLAIGMMLLAASPGGSTANLYSYLFKGDVALNISLTALNSIIAVVSLPFIVNLASQYFMPGSEQLSLQFSKIIQVFALVILPVGIGMIIRHFAPLFAKRMNKPVRIFSVIILVLVIIGALLKEKSHILDYIQDVGLATAIFCVASLSIGYMVPRLFNIPVAQARASAFEIGIHNSTLAMTIALSIMANTTVAVPAAVYSIFMFIFGAIFGFIITRVK